MDLDYTAEQTAAYWDAHKQFQEDEHMLDTTHYMKLNELGLDPEELIAEWSNGPVIPHPYYLTEERVNG